MDKPQPRAMTKSELQARILAEFEMALDYWVGQGSKKTQRERMAGFLYTVLSVLDGSHLDIPAFRITANPHPDDKKFYVENSQNWVEPGTEFGPLLAGIWNKHHQDVEAKRLERIEVRPTEMWVWECPACRAKNASRLVPAELSEEDEEDLREQVDLDPDMSIRQGAFLTAPSVVACDNCKREFTAKYTN